MIRLRKKGTALTLGCALWAGACRTPAMSDQSAGVKFVIVAPLCSSVIPVELSIDGNVVATDTFRVAVSDPHTVSRMFIVAPGQHTVGARGDRSFTWPTQTVSLRADSIYTDSLPAYCS